MTSSTEGILQEVEKEINKGLSDLFGTNINITNSSISPYHNDNKKHYSQNPYIHITKSTIIQNTKDFHDSLIVREKPNEIITTITQLLFLQNSNYKNTNNTNTNNHTNERLTTTEATDIFFGVTKLFVSTLTSSSNNQPYLPLRRIVYIILKELIPLCLPSDVIIITSCLTKDMTSHNVIYKSNALRVLIRIIDVSMLSAIERYIKQAILECSGGTSGGGGGGGSGKFSNATVVSNSSVGTNTKQYLHGMVSSAALVSSLHLFLKSNEYATIVKRWINEVYEVLKSSGTSSSSGGDGNNHMKMIQFHALILYYQMKKSDRLAISKFVQMFCNSTMNMLDKNIKKSGAAVGSVHASYSRNTSGGGDSSSSSNVPPLKSPLAITCLIRYTNKLLHEEIMEGRITSFTHQIASSHSSSSQLCTTGYQFLKSCLRHESEMVAFEAASSICSLATSTTSSNESDNAAMLEDIQPALSVLQLLLSSHKPAARLGTIKLLYKLSMKYPMFVCGRFNDSIEALIGDSNRLIGTLSIMTLIKTFSGSSNTSSGGGGGDNTAIDRLLKHISSFISHIADEYKIMVIKSLEQLCVSYPMKFTMIISFLSKFLREDGGFLFKRTIVHSIESLMEGVPETRDLALLYLCEFIEDCEYVTLSTWILTILGNLGPTATSPARYVRFIYNRCILDNAMIRSAAVLALSKFGASCPSLRSSILTLLRSCVMDENDETRDRVILAISILEDAEEKCPYDPLKEQEEGSNETKTGDENKDDSAVFLLMNKLPCTFEMLERRLKTYTETPGAMESNEPLSLITLPVIDDTVLINSEATSKQDGLIDTVMGGSQKNNAATNLDVISSIPEFAVFGRVLLSTKPTALTETEAEYVVHCVKHIFESHIILQFITQNTIEDQRLENVYVSVDNDSEAFEVTAELPVQSISYGTSASCYTVLERKSDVSLESCAFACELKFTVIQVDSASGEDEGEPYEEEYPLEDLKLLVSEFFSRTAVSDFRGAWESVGNANEVLQKFALQEKDLGSAVDALIDCIGLITCDGTRMIKPGAKQHMLHLSGAYLGKVTIVARSQVSLSPSGSIILKIAIRSEDAQVSRLVANCLG